MAKQSPQPRRQTYPVDFDELDNRLLQARALADALQNQDPECAIGHETLFHVSAMLVTEIDIVRAMWEQHHKATARPQLIGAGAGKEAA